MSAESRQWLRKMILFVLVLSIAAVVIGAFIGRSIAIETRAASMAYGTKVGGTVGFVMVGFPFLFGLLLYYARLKAHEEQERRLRAIIRDELIRQGK